MKTQLSLYEHFGLSPIVDYLIVINPSKSLSLVVDYIKKKFYLKFGYATYIDSPAHISLSAFSLSENYQNRMLKKLDDELIHVKKFRVDIDGFDTFNSGTLFLKPSVDEIIALQNKMILSLKDLPIESKRLKKLTHPHLTIAKTESDLILQESLRYFSSFNYKSSFEVNSIRVLKKNRSSGANWSLCSEIKLG